MRTPTEHQYAVLNSEEGSVTYHRVRVYKAGVWVYLDDVGGHDFQVGASWNESEDSAVTQVTVSVRRESQGLSIAPLVTSSILNNLTGSYSPLIGENTEFKIDAAMVPAGVAREEVDPALWLEVFHGVIDDVDPAGQGTFAGRDMAAQLLDAVIETGGNYGSEAGTPVQTVIQQLLNDNGFSSVVLVTVGDPDWALGPYKQEPGILWDAIQTLANQMGWLCRYRWHEASSAFRLTLYEPDRAGTTPVWEYSNDEYVELRRCQTSLIDVRNRVLVTYEDKTLTQANGKPTRPTIVREDLASQAKYGKRVFAITEASTSNIDTAPEATRLAEAALADLKDISLEVEMTVPYNPFIQLGDLVRLTGPTPNFTGHQDLAVVSINPQFGTERATVTYTLRGKPGISLAAYRKMDIAYRAPSAPFVGPLAPTGLEVSPTAGGFVLSFYPPVSGPKAETYELHLSSTSGFTPDLSAGSTTFYAESKSDTFTVTDLPPGVQRYARVVPKDWKNNAGEASAEVSLTTRYVEPRLFQPATNQTILPRNPDFEAANADGGAPDAWSFVGTTWGDKLSSTSASYSGARAVVFAPGAVVSTFGLRSELFTVRGGDQWSFGLIWKQSAFGTAGLFRVSFYADAADGSPTVGTSLERTLSDMTGEPIGVTWLWLVAGYKVPGSAKYARVEVLRDVDFAGTLTVDSVDAVRATAFWNEWTHLGDGTDPTHPYENDWSNYDTVNYYPGSFRVSTSGRAQMRGVAVAPTPAPAADAVITTLPAAYRPSSRVLRYIATSSGAAALTIRPDGEVRLSTANAGTILSFDGVEWELP